MAEVKPEIQTSAVIRVVGVGGGGGSAVDRMIDNDLSGIDFIAVNTDSQALHYSKAGKKIHIGKETTRGLGAGADPAVGQQAAEESAEDLKKALEGSDMVFVTFGAGGGTGSGAGPVVARIAQELDALVVGIATRPFAFEGERRRRNSEAAIENLRANVDTLIPLNYWYFNYQNTISKFLNYNKCRFHKLDKLEDCFIKKNWSASKYGVSVLYTGQKELLERQKKLMRLLQRGKGIEIVWEKI